MPKSIVHAAAIRSMLGFIDRNLGSFDTKQRQLDALARFIDEDDIQTSKGGYDPYKPTAKEMYKVLKTTVSSLNRRRYAYHSLDDDGAVNQLFTVGHLILEPEYLESINFTSSEAASAVEVVRPTGPETEDEDTIIRKRTRKSPAAGTPQPSAYRRTPVPQVVVTSRTEQLQQVEEEDHRESAEEHPAEIASADSETDTDLKLSWESLHSLIVAASMVLFPDDVGNRPAVPDIYPGPELHSLYAQVFADNKPDWKPVLVDLLNKNVLTGRDFFQSLIWRFLGESIIDPDMEFPFFKIGRLLRGSRGTEHYFTETLASQHHLDMADIRQQTLDHQLSDPKFLSDVLRPEAANLAHNFLLIMASHIEQQNKQNLAQDWHQDLVRRLTAICENTLLLRGKSIGDTSNWATNKFPNGERVNGPGIVTHDKFPGTHVAFTLRPGLSRVDNETGLETEVAPAIVVAMTN